MKVTVLDNSTPIPFEDVEHDQPFVFASEVDANNIGTDICWRNNDNDDSYFRLVLDFHHSHAGTLSLYEIEEPEEELVHLIDIKEVVVVLK